MLGWIAMYALCFFFINFGPNSTTFIYPAELFPTSWKSTGHGLSAAAGKAGAIVGAFGFLYASSPAKTDKIWSFPCLPGSYKDGYVTRKSDLATFPSGTGPGSTQLPGFFYSCVRKMNCPAGWIEFGNSPTADPNPGLSTSFFPATGSSTCDYCLPGVLSGCYPFGIGITGALYILAATNFIGLLFTFLLPETNQKSLEELSGYTGNK